MKTKLGFWIIAICMVCALFAGNVVAQDMALARDNSSPVSDARPGEYFYLEGAKAVRAGDYKHAVYEYKIAASWAHKVAQYNLAVIFFNAEGGINHDIPQALAWMMLAAERDDGSNQHKKYARDLARMEASSEQWEIDKAKELLKEMSKTYADEHALVRAKLRWNSVRMNITGSHVGSVNGNLIVGGGGARYSGGKSNKYSGGDKGAPGMATAAELTGGTGTDGTIAYRELRATDNPYDASWDVGTVTVGDVETLGKNDATTKDTPPAEPKKQ